MQDLSNETMIQVKKGELEFLQFRKLLEYDELIHGFTLKPIDVKKNRQIPGDKEKFLASYQAISRALEIPENSFIRPLQTHSDRIEIVKQITTKNSYENQFQGVDGLLTDTKQMALSLTFADCTPILLWDPIQKVIGNIHSGWKGTVQKIGQKAVQKMIETYQCNPNNIIACIGPCIGKCHFEVDTDVEEIFYQTFQMIPSIQEIITKGEVKEGKQKYKIDTSEINKWMLEEIGILPENISISNICTVCHWDKIHSYRTEGIDSGRNTAILYQK